MAYCKVTIKYKRHPFTYPGVIDASKVETANWSTNARGKTKSEMKDKAMKVFKQGDGRFMLGEPVQIRYRNIDEIGVDANASLM